MKPILIIGGGVAGLAAAEELRRLRVPFLLVDGASHLGGRWATSDLGADIGCPYFNHRDATLMSLIRRVGMDAEVLSLQSPVMKRRSDGSLHSTPTSHDANRVTLRRGMASLAVAWERELVDELVSTPVSAVRWLDDDRCFILRHADTGQSVRHPMTHQRIEARGVIVATPAPAALLMAENSRCLAPIVPSLAAIRTARCVVGVFRVPHVEGRWYALECEPGGDIDWLAFEERKVPTRAAAGESVLVVRASWKLAEQLAQLTADAPQMLFEACRSIVPELPATPIEARVQTWNSAWPLEGSYLTVPETGIATEPDGLALAIAGDYTVGPTAELAAQSGTRAARQVLARLG